MDERAIIVFGNFSDGFQFVGPFDSFDEAADYAEGLAPSWVATLSAPLPKRADDDDVYVRADGTMSADLPADDSEDNPPVESDDELRNRIVHAMPRGHTYTAEDVGSASGEILDRYAREYKLQRKRGKVIATFHPQVWQQGSASDVDAVENHLGKTTWNVTDEIRAMGEEIALSIEDNSYESDELGTSDSAPMWIVDWFGPFWIEVEESIRAYYGVL